MSTSGSAQPEHLVRAVELELAEVGYVVSSRLRARLATAAIEELAALRSWSVEALASHVGGGRKHVPLFRSFPAGVPEHTLELWWRKVLVHFLQSQDQPCLFCRGAGSTHVLDPCKHVVCDRCFDGASYSACPVCEHHVDLTSPFFLPSPERGRPAEKVVFKLLDLGEDELAEAKALFSSLVSRQQALSPDDREALQTIVGELRERVLSWLPPAIPVKETVALVFGGLCRVADPGLVMAEARPFMATATDVLRFIAVFSGTDGSLKLETIFQTVEQEQEAGAFWLGIASLLGVAMPQAGPRKVMLRRRVARFKVAKLPRALRRALLGLLESMPPDRVVEDMLRHRSYWVWVGEFLHPHEFAARFPNVAHAFQVVRTKGPDGRPGPAFHTWASRLEQAIAAKDLDGLLALLAQRPGELARRFDLALRLARDEPARERVLAAFVDKLPLFATPVLVTLRSHLGTRAAKAAVRVFWPKGRVARGVSAPDERAVLPAAAIAAAVGAIDNQLLARFANKPAFAACLIDEALRSVIVPFNERTASRSAVSLPRGSRVQVPAGKSIRLFLHWCQPEHQGFTTDLDLSVGFYDADWRFVGVCSYYQLRATTRDGSLLAQSAGDLRDGPWPDGATEFVDLDCVEALSAGVRYVVMVVNNYAGMPFSTLERAFAGLMLRDDLGGHHFDPRTVELKFALEGENGVFLPCVFDLWENSLHWLDVQTKGQFECNNVATSNSAITRICPHLITYFESGARTSLFDLGLLHAAARCERVWLRGETVASFVRGPGETTAAFHARLVSREADETSAEPPAAAGPPLLALLARGDTELPEGSSVYALFRDRVTPTLAASDLLS